MSWWSWFILMSQLFQQIIENYEPPWWEGL